MTAIRVALRRLRHHLSETQVISAGAILAAATGEPALAHQLERIRAQTTRNGALHRGVGRLETT